MKKELVTLAAGFALAASGQTVRSDAQTVGGTYSFQQAGVIGTPVEGFARVAAGGARNVAGKPVSATEERKTVQTLGDGTELSNSDSNLFYRDVVGRTRTEQTVQGRKLITIRDTVGMFTVQLDTEAKTAIKSPMPQPMAAAGGRGGGGVVTMTGPTVTYSTSQGAWTAIDAPSFDLDIVRARVVGDAVSVARSNTAPARGANEDLGVQSVNGVPAVGSRNTLTIPAGQIGNNREIKVVNERWYSDDLQMVVKTVNSDPRFGVTTYQLTNIDRGNPDPSLFQIPDGYTVTERAGRGGGMGGALPAPTLKKQ